MGPVPSVLDLRIAHERFGTSGVQIPEHDRDQFHYRHGDVLLTDQLLKSKVGNILTKATALRVTFNIDGVPTASKSHTHPSHSEPLKYPNNLDQSLNDADADKIRKYRADYSNRPPSAV